MKTQNFNIVMGDKKDAEMRLSARKEEVGQIVEFSREGVSSLRVIIDSSELMQRSSKESLEGWKAKQQKWIEERQTLLKKIRLLEEELAKQKALNNSLLKNKKHKRASSEQQTFIFNQTNISSYYPIVVVKPHAWNHRATLRSHLDSVRAAGFTNNRLVTTGEDATLKIWKNDHLQLTLREHLGPVYAIASSEEVVFTAGAQGVLRKWKTSDLLAGLPPQFQGDFHEEPIWSLALNQKNNLLILSSADRSLRLVKNVPEGCKEMWNIKVEDDAPTVVEWIADNRFASGMRKGERVGVFEVETGDLGWEYSFEGRGAISQANCLQMSQKLKMLVGGHEDHFLRFYDPNSNKKIKEIAAHSDAVTSVTFKGDGFELLSGSHDGNLRVWDLRKYKCVSDLPIHLRKYDEGVLCLALQENVLAVGGADGLVKVYQQGE